MKRERCAYLRPTVIHCDAPTRWLANQEYMFPFVTVVECPREKMLERIGQEIRSTWGLESVRIQHRLGRLNVGETSVVIVVSAPHRDDAFAACQYAINRLKRIVPIWKKEVFEDGEVWVEGPAETVEVP